MEILSKRLLSTPPLSGEKILPDSWGTIVGAGISSAPNDPSGPNNIGARRVLCIRTSLGAVAVYFDPTNITPIPEEIQSSFFCATATYGVEYTEEFNSGYYANSVNCGPYPQGRRCPAIATIESDRCRWKRDAITSVRVIKIGILGGGWEVINGLKSNQVTGYTFEVSPNGTLTIIYKNEIVMSFR